MLNLQKFIKENPDWEAKLSGKPYFVKVKRDDGYVMFSYNQIESDFATPIVQECRGIILLDGNFKSVCVPFFKFFNAGEPHAHNIDWGSAVVQEKLDGSLIKVWHDKEWRVSTNGTIDARKATLGNSVCKFENFGELFVEACRINNFTFDGLDKGYTYMFELVSPHNKIIVHYGDIDIYHIGTRNNKTLSELDVNIGIKKPKVYPLRTLEGCERAAKDLPFNDEGYVVVDKDFNRVKIKSPEYVRVHRLGNNGVMTINRIIEIIRLGEQAEFLTYYPEYKGLIDDVSAKIDAVIDSLAQIAKELGMQNFETQKDFALAVKDLQLNAFYFKWYKNREISAKDWVWQNPNDRIERFIEGVNSEQK